MSKNGVPRVSVGLPVFNGELFLAESIESVLAQDYTDFELVIADNASTDSTLDIVRRYAAADDRIRILTSDTNRGAAWNFNRVARSARGEFFKWATHDDLIDASFLRACLERFDADRGVVLSHGDTVEIDDAGLTIREREPDEDVTDPRPSARFAAVVLRPGHPCFQVVGLIRRATLMRTGLIGAYSSSDFALIAELALHGPFARVPQPLMRYRDHSARSMRAYPDARERRIWFDPSAVNRGSYPNWRLVAELRRAVRRASLSPSERRACAAVVARWAGRRWDPLGRETARFGLERVGLRAGAKS